jgi:Abnormal spindle-like microcephaly-assoc'd, ASPM-SPD-2-Hydin
MTNNYESRMTNNEWGVRFPHSLFVIRHLSIIVMTLATAFPLRAQVSQIVTVRPDRVAPGMNVVVELLTRYDAPRPFGYDVLDSLVSISLVNLADTARVVLGPPIVSWNGRLIQIPLFIVPNASLGPAPFYVFSTLTGQSDTVDFIIDSVQHLGTITGNTTIGNGFGKLSASNTILVDSLIVTNARVHFSLTNPDTLPSNPRLLPVVILSKGPVRLTNSTIFVDADSLDGGPGGGGGGHGWGGSGGIGFTGGGSCPSDSLGNAGSDSSGIDSLEDDASGGRAATGVVGGGSNSGDQGGGGGTGAPYGSSGLSGIGNISSPIGGFGGGSGGGEAVNPFIEFGGGGGGFGTAGIGGGDQDGQGLNGGVPNGGRFLVPMAGGSGGGAGNTVDLGDGALGASGGGGGGALAIISYDSIVAVSSTLSAQGDSGMTGLMIAAGGGGGSGGAIYLASPKGIRANASSINVSGGIGGKPASDSVGFMGGTGGLGRIRIDGATNLTPGALALVWTNGISLSSSQPFLQSNESMRITGFAQDITNTLDTVRIFYRTRHTSWQSVDTIRASDGSWSKWLPISHDSVLFVAAFVEVNQPASDPTNFDYEPSWLVSNASLAIISQRASPFLVVQDTLNFGTVRISKCKTFALAIHNDGEAPLMISKGALSGSPDFSIAPDVAMMIAPYTSDTIEVQFCPDSAGADSATITFTSNDSANSPKIVTLLGSGLVRHDSLVISPASVHFNPMLVGDCESDTVTLLSAGTDTLYFNQSKWKNPPFTMKLSPSDTALAPNKKELLIITFCPMDSGDFHQTQVLDERQDSIVLDGVGVIRRVASIGSEHLGISCFGQAVTFVDTISNLGNDTIAIESIQNGNPQQNDSINAILQPHERYPIAISWVPDSVGIFNDTIRYRLSDTTLTTTLIYRVAGAELHFDSVVPFHFVCIGGGSEILTDTVTNAGLDTIALSHFNLQAGGPFSLLDSESQLLPGQSIHLQFAFTPSELSDTTQQSDTLHITLSDAGCDTVIAIVLTGRGIDSGLAADPIDFDSVLTGQCPEDSSLIGNPCGPSVIIDSVTLTNPFIHFVSLDPDTIPSHGSAEAVFRFCPLDTGTETDTAILYPHGGEPFTVALHGIGFARGNPWAHFTISSASARADSVVTTSITLDSSSLTGKHRVRGVISFDPVVLSPIISPNVGFPISAQQVDPDSIAFIDSINFSDPGLIEDIAWLTLVGPRASSAINFLITFDTNNVNVTVVPGKVTVTDCTGLNGQFSPGGDYALGPVTPNPATDVASLSLTLGNDGYVEAGLYDMTGKLIQNILAQSYNRGSYTITIPMDGLSSGRYMIVLTSLGWRAARPLVVDR